jgi:hypothetical protein
MARRLLDLFRCDLDAFVIVSFANAGTFWLDAGMWHISSTPDGSARPLSKGDQKRNWPGCRELPSQSS